MGSFHIGDARLIQPIRYKEFINGYPFISECRILWVNLCFAHKERFTLHKK